MDAPNGWGAESKGAPWPCISNALWYQICCGHVVLSPCWVRVWLLTTTASTPERQEQWLTLVASNHGARHRQPSTGASFVVPATSCCLPSAWMATLEACLQHGSSAATRALGKGSGRMGELTRGRQPAADGSPPSCAIQTSVIWMLLRAPSSLGRSAPGLCALTIDAPRSPKHSITLAWAGINIAAPSSSPSAGHELLSSPRRDQLLN
jgi:hypothetical protein